MNTSPAPSAGPAKPAVVVVDEQPRMDFAEENISGVLLAATPRASATVAFVAPHEAQTLHLHQRPDNGDEIIFVYRGRFRLTGQDWPQRTYDTDADGPVYVQVPTKTPVSIVNAGDSEVAFYTVFTPAFAPGEINYLE